MGDRLRPALRKEATKVCAICNVEFQPRRTDSKYVEGLGHVVVRTEAERFDFRFYDGVTGKD